MNPDFNDLNYNNDDFIGPDSANYRRCLLDLALPEENIENADLFNKTKETLLVEEKQLSALLKKFELQIEYREKGMYVGIPEGSENLFDAICLSSDYANLLRADLAEMYFKDFRNN